MDPRMVREEDFPARGRTEEKLLFLLNYAVLAPSTHNTQPWQFEIRGDSMHVHPDFTRALKEGDPKNRYLFISLGTCIENLVIAAARFGYLARVTYPSRNGEPFAAVQLSLRSEKAGEAELELWKTITRRRNPRGPFLPDNVPFEHVDNAQKHASGISPEVICTAVTDRILIKRLSEATRAGVAAAHDDPLFRREMSHYLKNSFFPGPIGIPGFTLGMPALLSLIIPTMVRFIDLGDVLAEKSAEAVRTAPLALLFGAENDEATSMMTLGRAAERAMLYLQSVGYDTSIFVGGIEAELITVPESVHGAPVHFMFVAGRLEDPKEYWRYAPREPVSAKMKSDGRIQSEALDGEKGS